MRAVRFDASDSARKGWPAHCNECKAPFVTGDHIVRGKMYSARWAKHLRCFEGATS